jgi:regulatory protein
MSDSLWNNNPSNPPEPAHPRITALAISKRNPNNVTVKVNGKSFATLPLNHVADLRLAIDQPWTPSLAHRVADEAAYAKALGDAMKRLNRRMMTTAQLRKHLQQRGHDQPAVTRSITRLTELNLLNDQALGRQLAELITARRPAGPSLLRKKLRDRGIDPQLTEIILTDTATGKHPTQDAIRLAKTRLRSLKNVDPATRRRRLCGLLARRGFEPDTIHETLQQLLGHDDPETPEID